MITHPVRARILAALMGRQLTAQQIGQVLPDVPLSSIYRHVRTLAEGGILQPVDEVRVNGTATKVYAVRKGEARIRPEDTAQATPAEQLAYFTTFLNILAEAHRTYLERGGVDPQRDPIHSLMGALHVSSVEYRELMERLQALLAPYAANPPGDGRRRIVFAHAAIPDQPDPPLC